MFRAIAIVGFLILLIVDVAVVITTRQKDRSDRKPVSLPYYVSRIMLAVLLLAVISETFFIIRFFKTPNHITNEAATIEARALLDRAGGVDKIEEEVRRLFAAVKKGEATIVQPDRLKDYPAIMSLGDVDGIQPATSEMPMHIRVLAGNHFYGFRFALCNPDDRQIPVRSTHLIRISNAIYIFN